MANPHKSFPLFYASIISLFLAVLLMHSLSLPLPTPPSCSPFSPPMNYVLPVRTAEILVSGFRRKFSPHFVRFRIHPPLQCLTSAPTQHGSLDILLGLFPSIRNIPRTGTCLSCCATYVFLC